ncbi:peptidoglycan-binding protein [Roseateles sp. L2-2]|uniref:peptidoglycan-binding protein n=1 Tax=Roseateles sp. L2-2 TaxID=3422597 RepID=UPI003D35CC6C
MTVESGDLATVGGWMDAATERRQLPDPKRQVDAVENTNDASSALYIRALRSRLVSLGYLAASEAEGDTLTPPLQVAIMSFQKQAGLATDGWAGPLTKEKLQQLVSFEDGQDIRAWGATGERPAEFSAVHRAVYLRLYTLGCFSDWSQPLTTETDARLEDNPAMQEALERFLDHALALGLITERLAPVLAPRTLAVLFGHDAMIRALGASPGFVAAPAHRQFVDALGRVELWLLGYDVAIAREPTTTRVLVPGTGPRGAARFIVIDPAVDEALGDFFGGKALAGIDRRFLGIPAVFFERAAVLSDAQSATPDAEVQDAVLQDVADHQAEIVDRLDHLAARVWDGIKRAWAWLKAKVKQVVENIKDRLWNVARVIASSARGAYELVLKAVDVVHHGVVCLRGRTLGAGLPHPVILAFGRDFDTTLFVEERCDPEELAALIDHDAAQSQCLGIACRLMGLLLRALRQVSRVVVVAAGAGWLLLLLGLSRLRAALREFGDELEALKAFEIPEDSLYRNPVR